MSKLDPATDVSLLLVGVVGAARGLKGEVRVKSFTDNPADIGSYGELTSEDGKACYKIKVTGKHKTKKHGESVLARIEGVEDRTAAENVRGLKLFVRPEQMPKLKEDEFYFSELVGLDAVLVDGKKWGRVVLADDFGAGPVLEVELLSGKNEMVPFTMEVVPEVNLEKGLIVVVPPEGLLVRPEDEEQAKEQEGEIKETSP
ncbi:MAG: 16S rRNA processing protein RimM [Rhodospirillaceae bacterium]|nr:16S rRNA processing protein RimM [Rhodospirillaceae bacterium]